MSRRFLAALWIVVFYAVFWTWPEADAQVQNGSVFNSQGPAPNIGPAPAIQSGDNPPNGSTAGAIQAIAADPSNPGTIYAGSPNGGIWKTTNGGTNWTPLIDQKASLSIASLALDPTDSTHQTLIAGTGATSNGGFGSISMFSTPETTGGLQNGLLYSRNGGTSWTRLGETALSGQSVVGVAARGSTILAATFEPQLTFGAGMAFTGGLFRSSNTGATFSEVSGAPGSGLPLGPVSSLVSDPRNPNVFYAAVTANSTTTLGQTSVYVGRNAGATWQPVFTGADSNGLITAAVQTFIRIAAGPNNTLALGVVEGSQLVGLFYSSNAGATWSQLITPDVNPGRQAGTNLALAIDPNNSNLVYVMGDSVGTTANGLASALAIFRVDAAANTDSRMSDDNGATGNTANGSWVHSDGRVFAFDANGRLLTGTDGGLYVRTNPQSSTGIWQGLQGNFSVMELYKIAYDSNSERLVVAMQDNSLAYQSAPGSSRFNVVGGGGDGLNAVVNDVTLGTDSAIYVSSQELLGLRRLIVDHTGTIISPLPAGFDFVAQGVPVFFNVPVAGASFSSPFVLNNIDKTRIALAGSAVYVTQDTLAGANGPGATSVVLSLTELGNTNRVITAIDYGTRNNPNALLAGGGTHGNLTGELFLSTSAAPGSLAPLPAYSGLAPTSVKFDLRSDQRFFVADSVDLFGSLNRGANFQTLTANLPAKFIRPTSLAFLDTNGVDALFVGGLNNADNAGNPLVVADSNASGDLSGWRRFGSGLPNTTIFALSYNEKSDTLAIGTVGRGAYLLYDVTSNFASATVLQFGLAGNDSNPDPALLFGNRPLIKYGNGTLTINGPSTYTGTTTVLSGTMAAGVPNAFAPTSAFTVLPVATLDLRSFNQIIGSLAGTGTVTSNGMGAATLTTGNDNTNTIFSGTIANGSGVLALTKIGLGTFTLSGPNTYGGGTNFNGGILAINNDTNLGSGPLSFNGGALEAVATVGGITSSKTITLNAGGGTFLADAGTGSTLSGVISGAGAWTKTGPGTLTLSAMNTYSGGTLIQAGTLVAGTVDAAQAISFALGKGNVFLQGGTLRTPSLDPLVINVGGNYVQGPAGTLALGVAGLNGKDYDRIQAGGNASLNGTLAMSSLNNFRPFSGNAFEVLRTNGRRSGQFAGSDDSLNNNPNLARVDLYAPNGVALVYVSGLARSPIIVSTPILLPPVDPDAPLSLPLIPLLDPTAEQLTSLYEISFSGSNIQRLNLDERLAEIQRGSTGFSSNVSFYSAPVLYEDKVGASNGKAVAETPPVLQPTPQNRWGVWVNGWGDFVSVSDDSFAKGYDFTTGGVTVGIDYRITDHLALGLFGSYAHTWTDLRPGDVDVNTGRGGLYATYFDRCFYLNGAVFGGYNSYDTSRQALLGMANGSSDGAEFSTFGEAGYDFHFGNLTVGPLAALQYTYVNLNGFTEQGSLVPLQIHSDSQDSLRTDLGLRASYGWQVGNVSLIPSVTAAWEHEYKYSALPITVSAPVFGGLTETLSGPSEGHDSAIINAGVGIQWTPRISTYVAYQGQLGRDRYDSNGVSGGVSFSF